MSPKRSNRPSAVRRSTILDSNQLPGNPVGRNRKSAADALGLTLISAETAPNDYARALAVIERESPDAIVPDGAAYHTANKQIIIDFATRKRIPLFGPQSQWTDAGALLSYSTNERELARIQAGQVARILKGANPAEIPVEQPTKFELIINLKTAKTLSLTIPPSLLARADQVIE
jgi:putative ABC transport system substrate-binding protein